MANMIPKPQVPQLTPVQQSRIDNQIHPRAVVGWQLIGSSCKPNGRQIPGCTKLLLGAIDDRRPDGGFIWYPESTSLDTAIADAADRGFEVTVIRASLADWIKTGKGARFELK